MPAQSRRKRRFRAGGRTRRFHSCRTSKRIRHHPECGWNQTQTDRGATVTEAGDAGDYAGERGSRSSVPGRSDGGAEPDGPFFQPSNVDAHRRSASPRAMRAETPWTGCSPRCGCSRRSCSAAPRSGSCQPRSSEGCCSTSVSTWSRPGSSKCTRSCPRRITPWCASSRSPSCSSASSRAWRSGCWQRWCSSRDVAPERALTHTQQPGRLLLGQPPRLPSTAGFFESMRRSSCSTFVPVMGHLLGAHQTGQLMCDTTGPTICS